MIIEMIPIILFLIQLYHSNQILTLIKRMSNKGRIEDEDILIKHLKDALNNLKK
jgi:hypothetical protein